MTDRLSTTIEAVFTSKNVKTHYVPANATVYIESGPDPQIEEQDEKDRLEAEQQQP